MPFTFLLVLQQCLALKDENTVSEQLLAFSLIYLRNLLVLPVPILLEHI